MKFPETGGQTTVPFDDLDDLVVGFRELAAQIRTMIDEPRRLVFVEIIVGPWNVLQMHGFIGPVTYAIGETVRQVAKMLESHMPARVTLMDRGVI